MRRVTMFLVPAVFLFIAPLYGQTAEQKIAADAFLTAFVDRQWDRLEVLEHPNMREKIDRQKWQELLDGLEAKAGNVLRHVFHSAASNGSYASIVHRLHFEKDSVGVRVVVDSMNLIGGFWLDPIQKEYRFAVPDYADTSAFTEIDATIGTEFVLPAKLSIPLGEGPFPAVVLVHGSGPSDMDQTIGGNKAFRDIAWGLASRGIMVLRYEKRTKKYGAQMSVNTLTIQEETIDDALLALQLLNGRSEADSSRIILIGHSLGASVAPEIAAHSREVDGVVMLAPIARPLAVVIGDQLRFIASAQDSLNQQEKAKLAVELDKVEKIRTGELMKSKRLMGMPASYFYDLQSRDQKAYALGLGLPMFIARGSKDYQSMEMEMVLWKDWLKDVEDASFRTYSNCYHLFIETEATPGPWNYQQEGNVTPLLIDDLEHWCKTFTLPEAGD